MLSTNFVKIIMSYLKSCILFECLGYQINEVISGLQGIR
jgi:hypothetical protein